MGFFILNVLGVTGILEKTERLFHGITGDTRTTISFDTGGILIIGHYYFGGAIISTGFHTVRWIGGYEAYKEGGSQEVTADTNENYGYSLPNNVEYWYFSTKGVL